MSTEKFQFPPHVPEIHARVRITGIITDDESENTTCIEEVIVTNRIAYKPHRTNGVYYRFHTNGTIFKNIECTTKRYGYQIPDTNSSISVTVEILPAKPAEGS